MKKLTAASRNIANAPEKALAKRVYYVRKYIIFFLVTTERRCVFCAVRTRPKFV